MKCYALLFSDGPDLAFFPPGTDEPTATKQLKRAACEGVVRLVLITATDDGWAYTPVASVTDGEFCII